MEPQCWRGKIWKMCDMSRQAQSGLSLFSSFLHAPCFGNRKMHLLSSQHMSLVYNSFLSSLSKNDFSSSLQRKRKDKTNTRSCLGRSSFKFSLLNLCICILLPMVALIAQFTWNRCECRFSKIHFKRTTSFENARRAFIFALEKKVNLQIWSRLLRVAIDKCACCSCCDGEVLL